MCHLHSRFGSQEPLISITNANELQHERYGWIKLPPCWWLKQKKICSHSLHKNGSSLLEEKDLIVPYHQHGCLDVTCNQSLPVSHYSNYSSQRLCREMNHENTKRYGKIIVKEKLTDNGFAIQHRTHFSIFSVIFIVAKICHRKSMA